jgi:hypothetical protein
VIYVKRLHQQRWRRRTMTFHAGASRAAGLAGRRRRATTIPV